MADLGFVGPQDLPARALHQIVLRIVAESSERNLGADRFGLCRDDTGDLARLQTREDLRIGITGIRRDSANGGAGGHGNRVETIEDRLPLVDLAGGDLDIENDAAFVIDRAMLLVTWLQTTVPTAGRHGRVRIGEADLLELPGLPRLSLALLRFGGPVAIRIRDGIDMAHGQALPSDVGSDQRGIDMDDFALGDACGHAGCHGACEDAPETLCAPAVPDTGQRGMIREPLVQTEACEPADRQIDLRLAHQAPVMDDPEKKTRQHQPHGGFGIDAGAADAGRIEIRDIVLQPAEIEHAIHPCQNMLVRNKIAQRAADEKFELIAVLPSDHVDLQKMPPAKWNQQLASFSTAPPRSAATGRPAETRRRFRPGLDKRLKRQAARH